MSLKVIELNDSALKVGDENGILLQSPGFALSQNRKLLLGEIAEQQARLHPANSYNKYWHELSLDPLSHGNGIRHFADIAYAHLLHLAETAAIDGDVIFAVPGNFTRQQLAILLGLAKRCPFTTIGVVDSALAAAVALAKDQSIIYADIQLHQVLLTKLIIRDQHLKVESVIQVPGVGSQNFMDLMMQLATSAFIQQSRFNPQHNAESEQQLYNTLPHWWRHSDENQSSLILELKNNSAVHTVKMPQESLVSNLSGHYRKISQQIVALAAGGDSQVLISTGLAALPGITVALRAEREVQMLDPATINTACLKFSDLITSSADGIHLVNALQFKDGKNKTNKLASNTARATESQEAPTHALYSNRAISLSRIEIQNNSQTNGLRNRQFNGQFNEETNAAQTIQLSIAGLPDYLGHIETRIAGIFLDSGKQRVLVNQSWISGKQQLKLGDRIQFSEDSEAISLIQVKG